MLELCITAVDVAMYRQNRNLIKILFLSTLPLLMIEKLSFKKFENLDFNTFSIADTWCC